jgi:hypothetical protein
MIAVEALSALSGVRHAFFTRNRIVGERHGNFNCAYRATDPSVEIDANRETCADAVGVPLTHLVTVKQRHTADVIVASGPVRWDEAPVTDAIVTDTPQLALGVLTADCGPVLMADANRGVVAAAHAGWRGALDGILENTIAAMERLGARRANIVAALGPCIGRASYEVGPEFTARFMARDTAFGRFFDSARLNGRRHFDLPGFIIDRLTKAGIGMVAGGTWDTCADDAEFFSYRRSVLRGEADYGRHLSVIALTSSRS